MFLPVCPNVTRAIMLSVMIPTPPTAKAWMGRRVGIVVTRGHSAEQESQVDHDECGE